MPQPSSGPRSRHIYDDIRAKIQKGEYEPGAELPSIGEVQIRYGSTQPVARHALRKLVNDGLVESRPGEGFYVRTDATPATDPRRQREINAETARRLDDLAARIAELERTRNASQGD